MRTGAAGVSGLAALVLLLPMEAGVPVPLPADLVTFTVGERVAAGQFPLWLAVAGFEVIAALGTTALFAACRGSGYRVLARYGPRLGLTQAICPPVDDLIRGRSRTQPGRGVIQLPARRRTAHDRPQSRRGQQWRA